MRDKIIFDIETKNTFADVGGQENIKQLDASVIGLYSYNEDAYYCFGEDEFDKAGKYFQNAYLLIGFASKRFDVPVLEKYYSFNIAAIPHADILEEIEKRLGRRIGLGVLAEANVGQTKTAHGLDAIDFYKNGEIQKLKDYCTQDVHVTRLVYEQMKNDKFLWIPERNKPQMTKLEFADYIEITPPPAQLF